MNPQARLAGVLELHDGCIQVNGTVLVLPTETVWEPDTQELTNDGFTIKVGDDVDLTGGRGGAELADRIPAACDPDSLSDGRVFKTSTFDSSSVEQRSK